MHNFLVRVQLPDRPGALGAVASRIGSVGGDVVSIEILQRDNGVVIDELGVGLRDDRLLPLLQEEIREVDGAHIEAVRVVDGPFPDRYAELLEIATDLFAATSAADLPARLAMHVRTTLDAEFAAVVESDTAAAVAASGDVPDGAQLSFVTRWAMEPLPATMGIEAGSAVPDASALPYDGPSIATADLVQAGLVLVVGRHHPVLRARERQWIAIMAEMTDHGWRSFA